MYSILAPAGYVDPMATQAHIAPPRDENVTAIPLWREALHATDGDSDALLSRIYREFWPTQGELIFTGACSFQCAHCIYPPSFARHSRNMEVEQWNAVLQSLSGDVGIDTFVYGGRSINAQGLQVMRALRASAPEAQIGLIDNGISMLPHLDDLFCVEADWLDVSLDGLEEDHDRQRGRKGSFREGLQGAEYLRDNGFAPRVNILTCLTTLNYQSVCAMIREVNARGFKNFFITPITLGDGVGPSSNLRLSKEQLREFVTELQSTLAELQDAWVELLLFSADYVEDLVDLFGRRLPCAEDGRDELYWDLCEFPESEGSANTLFMRYYPISLTGVRELIVNTNGDVIVPKAMSFGQVPPDMVVGNLLIEGAEQILEGVSKRRAFDFYRSELRKEASLLRSIV